MAESANSSRSWRERARSGLTLGIGQARRRLHQAPITWANLSRRRRSLLILDDFFPNLLTAFRIAELNCLLRRFPDALVFSTQPDPSAFVEYTAVYPDLGSRVRPFHPHRRLRASAGYFVFLNNAFAHVARFERERIPFVLELYPGGGLQLADSTSDAKLRRVLGSPMFRRVIVTQRVTRDYLVQQRFCLPEQMEYVFGVVMLSDQLAEVPAARRRLGESKDAADVCFVAAKYTPTGADKGYDRFIEFARILRQTHANTRFHVVGGFQAGDVYVRDFGDSMKFYGPRPTSFFPEFYSRMDAIVSPNTPFLLAPGAFDGFPLGCCIEAALCGCAVFLTDPLQLNDGRFRDREELVLIPPEPAGIAALVREYLHDPPRLRALAEQGERAMRARFALEVQMAPRLRLIAAAMNE